MFSSDESVNTVEGQKPKALIDQRSGMAAFLDDFLAGEIARLRTGQRALTPVADLSRLLAERLDQAVGCGSVESVLGLPEEPGLCDSRTLFYPGCGLDLNPLFRLTHLYDRFVFCDLSCSKAEFQEIFFTNGDGQLGRDLTRRGGRDWLRVDSVEELSEEYLPGSHHLFLNVEMSDDEMRRYKRSRDEWERGISDWGYRVRLRRCFGGHERPVTLYFLRTEGAATYWRLFASRNGAPAAVCARPYFADMGLCQEGDLLHRAVLTSNRQPVMLHGDMYWPAEQSWQNCTWGQNTMNTRAALKFREPEPVVIPGRRRVVIHHGEIAPAKMRDVDATLAPPRVRREGRLPVDGVYLPFERVGFNRPMAESLRRLERYCVENRTDRVASVPFGLEDEGVVLHAWAEEAGFPHELHIYCPSIGDYHSLACCGPPGEQAALAA